MRGSGKRTQAARFHFSVVTPGAPAFAPHGVCRALAANFPQHPGSQKVTPTTVHRPGKEVSRSGSVPQGLDTPAASCTNSIQGTIQFCEKIAQFFCCFFSFFFFFSTHGKTVVQAQRLNKPALHPWIVLNHRCPSPHPTPTPHISFPRICGLSKAAQSSNDTYYFISLSCYISLYIYICLSYIHIGFLMLE